MVSDCVLVGRAGQVIDDQHRMMEIEEFNDKGNVTHKFKVRYYFKGFNSSFMKFKPTDLIIVVGRLANDNGEVVVIAEKMQYLTKEDYKAVEL